MVMVEKVGFEWEGSLFIKNLYISDQQLDTLVFIKDASVHGLKPFTTSDPVLIESLEIDGFVMNLNYAENDTISNLDFLLDFFQSDSSSQDTSSEKWQKH